MTFAGVMEAVAEATNRKFLVMSTPFSSRTVMPEIIRALSSPTLGSSKLTVAVAGSEMLQIRFRGSLPTLRVPVYVWAVVPSYTLSSTVMPVYVTTYWLILTVRGDTEPRV